MIQQRISTILIALSAALAISACGSSVKLDESQVSDAKGTVVQAQGTTTVASTAQGSQTGANDRSVQAVNAGAAALDGAGPAGAVKIILFDYDSFVIKPEYQSVIDSHARFLTANKAKKLAVEGHTDESGGREYNLALGQKRAEAVRRALAVLGVLDAQVEAVSFGEEKPVDAASNEQAYAKNRRAELNYK
jgi:peptidoglycan-associated lipoprotein